MKNKFFFSVFGFYVLLFGYNAVFACSCAISSPCRMDALSDASFVGKIKSVEKKGNSAVHKVEILKHYDGMRDKNEVEIYTDQVTSCAYSMKKDETYVIFARVNQETGFISTGYCSGTKPLSQAKKEVEFLESLKGAADGFGVLSGKVHEYDARYKFEKQPWKPKEINKVYLESENGEKFETGIDENGQYEFKNLKRGRYEVSVLVPDRLISTREIDGNEIPEKGFRKLTSKVKVPGSRCSASEYFTFYVNGVITGKVFDANGTSLAKMPVTIFRFEDSDDMPEKLDKVWTNEDGIYVAQGLPPARYLIGFGIDNSLYINSQFAGYLPVYYPNSAKRENSKYLVLGENEILRDKNIQLFPQLNKRKITGQVLYENGQPAKNADATFYVRRKVASDETEGGFDLKLNSEGNFELEIYDQTEYWILARVFDSEDRQTRKIIFSSKCYKILGNQSLAPISVILKKGNYNCDVRNLK